MMDIQHTLGITEKNPGGFSGASWTSSLSSDMFESINPSTEKTIASVSSCNHKDYETLIDKAIVAQKAWQSYPMPKRGEIIREIGEAFYQKKSDLAKLITLEMGKPIQESLGEVQEMIDMARFSTGLSRMMYGKTMHSERPHHRMYEQWHPYGLVGVITAFNFPVAVWAWNAFISAVCGNATIWKPSSETPLCAIAVMNICNEVLKKNNCPDIFSLMITKNHDIAEKLVNDKRIPLISFTGSTKAGRNVSERVAARLGKTILELGGNNAVIVDESADIALALRAIVFGALGTSGQRCTTTRRVFIHTSYFDQIATSLTDIFSNVVPASPEDKETIMGPLVNRLAVDSFLEAIKRLKKDGAKILVGGNVIKGPGFFVEPTLITDIQNDWPIVQEETFAPILYLMPFHTIEEAVLLNNAVPQGLSSALFTRNLKHSEYFLSQMGSDCGIANINIGTSGAEIGGAFGGEKETGGGREAGSDAWKAYMRRQTNTINFGDDLPLSQGIVFHLR